ncbi:MAG: sensor histidine kinase [Verrucomicrobiota bacterium]
MLVGSVVFGVGNALSPSLPPHVAWPLSMFLCGSAIFWLDGRMRQWFGLDDSSRIRALRTEVLQVAMQGADTARLTAEFESLLAVRHEAPGAVILARSGEAYTGGGHTIRRDRVAITALREDGWITPESLQRRRPNPALEDLDALLRELGAGALVAVPRESPAPNLLVAIGVRRSEWPFTDPDVTRLLHTAELIDNILTRSRLTDQLALRARMEYLAMMSRGLAHDLKNLITPVSSYLVHTEGRAPAGSAEEEVHSAASRSIGVMTTYLREALFFSERLTPRYAPVEPAGLLQAARGLAGERAARRGVTIVARSTCTGTLEADTVLLQRLLVNLMNNAIDASARGGEVRLTAEGPVAGMITLRVIDRGCGMDEATRARIFDPYFTTKEFGEEVRGFGLGLTISQRIAHLHHGRITVESRPGAGTTLSVDLPVDPAALATAF